MPTVFYDVSNTLDSPFITGIQRTVREYHRAIINSSHLKNTYVPVTYDLNKKSWRQLTTYETNLLSSNRPRSLSFTSRILHKLNSILGYKTTLISDLAGTNAQPSIFFDIDNSWSANYDRQTLLPKLKSQGIKVVKLHYDIIPFLYPETTHPKVVRIFEDHFFAHLQNSDLFICISECSKIDVEKFCLSHNFDLPKLTTVQLGSHAQTTKTNYATKVGLHKFRKYILVVGTIEPRKNHKLILEAFSEILPQCDLNLVIVGKIGWLSEEIESTVKHHPYFSKRIFFLGTVNDETLNALYKNAWLNVVPSLYEGFGLPITESLSHGCPTLASTAEALKETGSNYVMYFSPHSHLELGVLILNLVSDSSLYQSLKSKAKNFKPTNWSVTASTIDGHLSLVTLNE